MVVVSVRERWGGGEQALLRQRRSHGLENLLGPGRGTRTPGPNHRAHGIVHRV